MRRTFISCALALLVAALAAACGGTLKVAGDGDTTTDVDTDTAVDSSAEPDSVTDPGDDTPADTGADVPPDTEADSPADTWTDTGDDTGTDTAVDTGTDTATDTVTDTPAGGADCSAPGVAHLGTNYGDSSDNADSYAINGCNDQGGNDETWVFTAAETGVYGFEMQTAGFNAVVMVWADCGSTSAYQCFNPDPDSSTAGGTLVLDAGDTVYVLADDDTLGGTGGAYTLTITFTEIPPGDTCADPAVAADGTGTGDTSLYANDYDGECEGGTTPPLSGPDQVWQYTATCTGTLSVVMDTGAGGGGFNCTLDLWTACGDAGTSLSCDNDYYSGRDGVCSASTTVTAGDVVYILCDTNNAGVMGDAYDLVVDCV